jgi:hypothetical protein
MSSSGKEMFYFPSKAQRRGQKKIDSLREAKSQTE